MRPLRSTVIVSLVALSALFLIVVASSFSGAEANSSCLARCRSQLGCDHAQVRSLCNARCNDRCIYKRGLSDVEVDDDDVLAFAEDLASLVLSDSRSESMATTVCATDVLNMRSGACTSYGIVATIPNGAQLTRTGAQQSGCEYTWYQVQYGSLTGWVASKYVVSCGGGGGGTRGQNIVNFARAQIGKPYVWGGNGPNSFDCSGLTKAAYGQVGITIPRVTSDFPGANLRSVGSPSVGDLVWNNHHIAIYSGNGKIIHAVNENHGVKETDMSSGWMGGSYSFWTPK